MVIASIASRDFNWKPTVIAAVDPDVFKHEYTVAEVAKTTTRTAKSRFADLPSAGIWQERIESDDELLEKLGGDWQDFGIED